jgi:hypothetical protein
MLKLTIAVLFVAIAGTASAAGWRSLRVDGSSEEGFTKSLATFKTELSPARYYVLLRALQDVWAEGTKGSEAGESEYTEVDYLRQLDGLTYKRVVRFTDPTGDTAQQRLRAATLQQHAAAYARVRPSTNWANQPARMNLANQPAQIGPSGEQVRGTIDFGPAYQHQLRTMGQ